MKIIKVNWWQIWVRYVTKYFVRVSTLKCIVFVPLFLVQTIFVEILLLLLVIVVVLQNYLMEVRLITLVLVEVKFLSSAMVEVKLLLLVILEQNCLAKDLLHLQALEQQKHSVKFQTLALLYLMRTHSIKLKSHPLFLFLPYLVTIFF